MSWTSTAVRARRPAAASSSGMPPSSTDGLGPSSPSGRVPAEPVGEPPRRVRVAAHHGGEQPGRGEQPGHRVVQIAGGRRRGRGAASGRGAHRLRAPQRQHPGGPLRRGPGEGVRHGDLLEVPQREQQEGDRAVHGDQFADRDPAVAGEPGPVPDDARPAAARAAAPGPPRSAPTSGRCARRPCGPPARRCGSGRGTAPRRRCRAAPAAPRRCRRPARWPGRPSRAGRRRAGSRAGSSGSTASASTGTPSGHQHAELPAGRRPAPTQTPTVATAAAANRASASTNQPIFSTSPVRTATTSPAATRRVRTEPSSAVLRASSCCTRAAAVIQLVTAVRCSMVSPERDEHAEQQHQRAGQGQPPARAVDDGLHGEADGGGERARRPPCAAVPRRRRRAGRASWRSSEPEQETEARADVGDAGIGCGRSRSDVHDVPGFEGRAEGRIAGGTSRFTGRTRESRVRQRTRTVVPGPDRQETREARPGEYVQLPRQRLRAGVDNRFSPARTRSAPSQRPMPFGRRRQVRPAATRMPGPADGPVPPGAGHDQAHCGPHRHSWPQRGPPPA